MRLLTSSCNADGRAMLVCQPLVLCSWHPHVRVHTNSDTVQEEIERLERELKGSAALERIYKTTIEEKDAEIKSKTRRVETLEAENLTLKEKLIKAGGKP